MSNTQFLVQDPVCDEWVEQNRHRISYRTAHFSFCSERCKRKFLQTPDTYIRRIRPMGSYQELWQPEIARMGTSG